MAIELLGIVLRYPDWTKLEQIAMACMFGRASAQGNALINGLPGVINAAITVMLFVYFVSSGVKVANAFTPATALRIDQSRN